MISNSITPTRLDGTDETTLPSDFSFSKKEFGVVVSIHLPLDSKLLGPFGLYLFSSSSILLKKGMKRFHIIN